MTTRTIRHIVNIDEEKCNGCGACVIKCAEGALQIIDGKAKLISEVYCDGLGACLGECPEDAITITEREAADFDEEAVEKHLEAEKEEETLPCGCASATVSQFVRPTPENIEDAPEAIPAMLRHWPVQLTLVPPSAPFLKNADLLLTADCVPFAYAGFHRDFLEDHALVVACPKLDDFAAHQEKLTQILAQAQPRSLTIVHMEVPCCSGLVHMAKQALAASGQDIPVSEITIGIHGDRLD
ncbi:MAG: 4Fe-4S binding protein [Chloroflexota bacterium]